MYVLLVGRGKHSVSCRALYFRRNLGAFVNNTLKNLKIKQKQENCSIEKTQQLSQQDNNSRANSFVC